MKRSIIAVVGVVAVASLAVLWVTSAALGSPITPYYVDTSHQDPILLCVVEDELGDNLPFPADEWVKSLGEVETLYAPCAPNDNPLIHNIEVTIQNMTTKSFPYIYYVADEGTSLTNDDGLIGNFGLGDAQLAFEIDSVGLNTPLVYESIAADNIFQPNEIWKFVIQDFIGQGGRNAIPFDTLGIASLSPGGLSTGSLITPEPATMALVALGGVMALVQRKRKA